MGFPQAHFFPFVINEEKYSPRPVARQNENDRLTCL